MPIREPVTDVPCAQCGAGVGEECTNSGQMLSHSFRQYESRFKRLFAHVLLLPCPACGAPKGEVCMSRRYGRPVPAGKSSWPTAQPHAERLLRFNKKFSKVLEAME